MNKIRLLLIYTALPLFCAMIFGSPAYGQGGGNTQKRTVSGMVTDENDNPVSGATVIVQGTTTGTTTTAGKFTIQVTPASILEVKFLGYKTAEVKVGTQTNLTIKLETTSETIQDVVVTALGMTRERKSLGYSVGDIKGEAFEKVRELNVINSLAGREPGLIISQTAGGPSGSSHVEIRGSSMLTGNNQPLYVVDGMPIDNTNFGSANKDGGYDLGDGISSINPDDIENVEMLPADEETIARYGDKAANGVMLVTLRYDQSAVFTADSTFSGYIARQVKWGDDEPAARIVLRYTVTPEGDTVVAQELESTDSRLKRRVLKAVAEAPRWTPARKNGTPVESEGILHIQLPEGKLMPRQVELVWR